MEPKQRSVSCSSLEGSKCGMAIMNKGGSAVDAAVTTALCLGVERGLNSGLGGGAMILIYDRQSDKATVLDARECAPSKAHKYMFSKNLAEKERGGKAVAVPGELKGLQRAHELYGKLPWNEVVQPAIDMARNGTVFPPSSSAALQSSVPYGCLVSDPYLSQMYTERGRLLKTGELLVKENLAHTLEKIAHNGADEFYFGTIADEIIEAINQSDSPGVMTKEDLANYSVVERSAIETTFNNYRVMTVPLPAGGAALLNILNIMDGYDLTASDLNSTKYFHRLAEAIKFAMAQREFLCDPAFNESVNELTERIISKQFAEYCRSKIDENQTFHDPCYYGSENHVPDFNGTTSFSVIDENGMMVSITSTIGFYLGSMVMTKGGFVLNNAMSNFSIPYMFSKTGVPPSPVNFIEPGKRGISAMSPTVAISLEKSGDSIALGAAGSNRIITAVAQVLINYIIGFKCLQSSILSRRIHCLLHPPEIEFQKGFPQSVVKELEKLGHRISEYTALRIMSIVNAVSWNYDCANGFADPENGGKAVTTNKVK